jgi:hypothetical protein
MAAVRATMLCRMRTVTPATVCPPGRSRSSWPFEGVVDGFDDLQQRFDQGRGGRGRLALAGRAQQGEAVGGESGLEVAAVVVLVADQDPAQPHPLSQRYCG